MPQSKPIGFRLPPAAARKLAAQAALRGLTPGTFARQTVLAALADDTTPRLLDELAAARTELARLRADLARATAVLLAHAGNVEEDGAAAWVRDNLTGA
jgi:hypothetical protein